MLRSPNYMEFHTTPKQLRAFADRLEREMKVARAGQACPRIEIQEVGIRLDVVIDQGEWSREQVADKQFPKVCPIYGD